MNSQGQSVTNNVHLHVISFTKRPFTAWRTSDVLLRFQCIVVVYFKFVKELVSELAPPFCLYIHLKKNKTNTNKTKATN